MTTARRIHAPYSHLVLSHLSYDSTCPIHVPRTAGEKAPSSLGHTGAGEFGNGVGVLLTSSSLKIAVTDWRKLDLVATSPPEIPAYVALIQNRRNQHLLDGFHLPSMSSDGNCQILFLLVGNTLTSERSGMILGGEKDREILYYKVVSRTRLPKGGRYGYRRVSWMEVFDYNIPDPFT
ncbi:hypothetical protein V8B97DRAFT_1914044 [Scleroderma yunnanense]